MNNFCKDCRFFSYSGKSGYPECRAPQLGTTANPIWGIQKNRERADATRHSPDACGPGGKWYVRNAWKWWAA